MTRIRRHPILSGVALLLLIAFVVVGASAMTVWRAAHDDDASRIDRADVIIVLGAAQYGGTPSPVFQGRLGLDISYYGFELTVSDARSTPGWYFVLQEQPTEPRFHVPQGATVVDGYLLPTTIPTAPDTAASFAFDTCRTPIRVAVPAVSLVPET